MNRIIREKTRTLKAMGKQALSGHWGDAILLCLCCELIVTLPSILFDLLPVGMQTQLVATIFNVYAIFVHGPMSLSLANYFIKVFRQEESSGLSANLKFGFGCTRKAVSLYIRIMLITWLGSMFFLIPGIIAALNYSQAFYILADNPENSPAQCMIESKFIMRGNKITYLKLLLSFAGWYILAAIPAAICHIVVDASSIQMMRDFIIQGDIYNAIIQANVQSPLVSILFFLQVIVSPYINSSKVSFFDILVGKLEVRPYEEVPEAEL